MTNENLRELLGDIEWSGDGRGCGPRQTSPGYDYWCPDCEAHRFVSEESLFPIGLSVPAPHHKGCRIAEFLDRPPPNLSQETLNGPRPVESEIPRKNQNR
jgi:hypothetical protein